MSARNFPEYKYDISLEHGGSNHFMVWIIACLVFVATLSMFLALTSHRMMTDWRSYAANHATIEVPFSAEAEAQALLAAEAFAPQSLVARVEIIPPQETAALVTGALSETGQGVETALLPLPLLVDVSFTHPPDEAEIAELTALLEQTVPGAALHRHESWARDIVAYGEMLFAGAVLLVTLMAAITVLTLVWTLISRINLHQDEIEILTIIGADDRYIARQFQQFALTRTFTGCLAGIASAGLVLLVAGFRLDSDAFLSGFTIAQLIGWLLLPLGLCLLIAYAASRLTLSHTLSNLG